MVASEFIDFLDETYQSCGPDLARAIGGEDKITKNDILSLACQKSAEILEFWTNLSKKEQKSILERFSL
jgi:hypothetical protein